MWSQNNKHGVAKPLPCLLCSKWHLRLYNHLKNKHQMNKDQVKDVISEANTKYWLSESVGQSCSRYNKTVVKPINETQKVLSNLIREKELNDLKKKPCKMKYAIQSL